MRRVQILSSTYLPCLLVLIIRRVLAFYPSSICCRRSPKIILPPAALSDPRKGHDCGSHESSDVHLPRGSSRGDEVEEEEEEEDIITRFFQGIAESDQRDEAAPAEPSGRRLPNLALMAEAAADMPMDFLLYPEKAYYLLGGEMPVCRLVTGTWQVDGRHGYHPLFLDVKVAARAMVREHGYTTFDVAPFYGQMERWLGEVRMKIEDPAELDAYKIFTKISFPPTQNEFRLQDVEAVVDAALSRLRASRLDLAQLHWWDPEDPRFLDVLHHLHRLQEKGKVRHIGVTNFGAQALARALESGVRIVSNQVQFSLLDRRARTARSPVGLPGGREEEEALAEEERKKDADDPSRGGGLPSRSLVEVCQEHGVTLLCYGCLMGGFLTDRWVGAPAPDPRAFSSTSEEKYWEVLRAWGSWEAFQGLLAEVRAVARKHRSCVAHVALRWVLDQPAVGSVVVGTRLGYVEHLDANKEVLKLELTAQDLENLERAVREGGRDLAEAVGDVGVEYKRAVMEVEEGQARPSDRE